MRKKPVWFAEKANGEVIELTELEALTHFENNNISQRMRLRFLGTSDGSKYAEGKRKVKELLAEKRKEIPEYYQSNPQEQKLLDFDLRMKYDEEIRAIIKQAYEDELAQAKLNGVQTPDKTLRIITQKNGDKASGQVRQQIINSL